MRLRVTWLLVLALAGCRTLVLSPYGSGIGVGPDDHGNPTYRYSRHRGVDFHEYAIGDPVLAAADGRVTSVSFDPYYGTTIIILHPGWRRSTYYTHLKSASVARGARVVRGQKIGKVGLFGASGRVIHVHMELWNPNDERDRDHELHGTENPLKYSGGCFRKSKTYPVSTFVLTYPVPC